MLTFYAELAILSLRRNAALTILTVIAVGVGIGASMTVFTVFRAMSGDPIPEKSSQLYTVLIDNMEPTADIPWDTRIHLSYTDTMALLRAKRGRRQSASYSISTTVTPPDSSQLLIEAPTRAVTADFFQMFDVPFGAGGPWSAREDEGRANVAVVSAKLAARLFPGKAAIGQELVLDRNPYRIIGVLNQWDPQPHFYDVWSSVAEDVFVPFSTAIERGLRTTTSTCTKLPPYDWQAFLETDCLWVAFWVELPGGADAKGYRQFLDAYCAEQQRIGRFQWPPRFGLFDVREWLVRSKVVPDEVRLATLIAFSFLIVCLLNAVSLVLAKFAGRTGHLSVHRALGASRRDIFAQCLTETAILGLGGGLLGLALTRLGLSFERLIMRQDLLHYARLDAGMVGIILMVAIGTTLACGIYPSWRASQTPPALQLKTL